MAIGVVEDAFDQPMKVERIKINNDEEEEEEEINFLDWELMRKNYGLKDCDDDELKMSLSYEFDFDPPEIANLLAFMVYLEKDKIDELTHCIEAKVRNKQFDEEVEKCVQELGKMVSEDKIDELTHCIEAKVRNKQFDEEVEKCVQELGKMVSEDPRLGDLLQHHLLEILVTLLNYKQYPKLQSHAAIILQYVVAYSGNREVVMKFITPSIIVNLMGSAVCEVQQQALSLLRNIAFGIPNCSKSKIVLEETLESLTSLIDSFNESTGDDLLCIGSKTLALACQVYLDFCPDELESVLHALMKLLKYESSHVLSYACSGIMYLCDGKQKMVVEEQQLGTLVDRLIELIDSDSRVKTIGGLTALGSIVRWGSDSNVEVIIEKDTLSSLECLLGEDDMYYVKNACWIISNITARKENHIKSVIDAGLIEPLVDVVENYELLDVKREAARAISNAIYGLGLNKFRRLRNNPAKPLGDLLKVLRDDKHFVSVC